MKIENLLKNRSVLVGITSSISIYKSLELIRLFIKSGAKVNVVMSEKAKEMISPLVFEALSMSKVLSKETESWDERDKLTHISIRRDSDIFVIAPATLNTIGKMANGISDNLLLDTFFAFDKDIIVAPACNTKMYENRAMQDNLKTLEKRGIKVLDTDTKLLADGDEGKGALIDTEEIFFEASRTLLKDKFYNKKEVVITGGGAIEKIDDVRYLGNFSSGKMATNLAFALYLKGAKVSFITSKIAFGDFSNLPRDIEVTKVSSNEEYKKEIEKRIEKDYLIMASALSDFKVDTHKGKIKKSSTLNLELKENIDVLKEIGKLKGKIKKIGFKLESLDEDSSKQNAKDAMKYKELDAIILNKIDSRFNPLNSDSNEVIFISKDNEEKIGLSDKFNISLKISELIKKL